MNLKELHSFKLSDAITFHDKLNPKLWNNTHLRPEVKKQLLLIAEDFLGELGVSNLDVKDITVSGSNAAYSYTDHSDLDLHILVDLSELDNNEIYKELFDAKKRIYNDSHDIKIHGVPVELYVQDSREPVVSLGEYSILNDKWLRIPTKRRANFDQTASKSKYEKLLDVIQHVLKSDDIEKVSKTLGKIKQYRQAGLDKGGEFGPENLAYKALRSQGFITDLYKLRDKLHSEVLTIENMYQDPMTMQYAAEKTSAINPYGGLKDNQFRGSIAETTDEIHNYSKLDKLLKKLCNMVIEGQHSKKDYGMVASCVLDPKNNAVARLNYLESTGKRVHAERAAVEAYESKYGEIPKDSIIITTLSPCNETDDETAQGREGESCTAFLNSKGIKKVYCGYIDPTQDNDIRDFNLIETSDKSIREECKKFADTFLDIPNTLDEDENLTSNIVYHVTPTRNLKKIMRLGLLPQVGDRSQKITGEENGIFMFPNKDSAEDAVMNWLGDEFDEDEELSLLAVNIAGLNAVKGADYEIIVKDKVDPNRIKVMQDIMEASGYIPSEKEKNDPRFKTALTVDVKPDSIKKNAKAFYSNVSRAGIPPLARANGKF